MLRRRLLTTTLFTALASTAAVSVPAAAQAADPLQIRAMQCVASQAGSNFGQISCFVAWVGGEDPTVGRFAAAGGNLRDRREESDAATRRVTFYATCWTPTEIIVTATVTDALGVQATWQVNTRCITGRAGQ
ncbi:hypothetical protein [Actinoplanes sp. NPDC023714]|uniref:hypothetical protein n=1 Tax=Actinoplanes sp. NPDC023714 TaxID=3154322 RepID=UPI0033F3EFB9